MKKFISLILAALMSMNICMAANALTLSGTYTFADTAYSPELGAYVLMAKDLSSGAHATEVYFSENGTDWKKVLSSASGKNYANGTVRQNIVWWESQKVFVAQIGGDLYISADGQKWTKTDGKTTPMRGYANNMVETNGDMLVTAGGKAMRIYKNLTDKPEVVEFTTNTNYYAKTIAMSHEQESIVILDQWTLYSVEGAERTVSSVNPNMEGTPLETVYIPGTESWIITMNNPKIRVLTLPKSTTSIEPLLEDGKKSTEKITAVGADDNYIILGTASGKFLYTEKAPVTTATVWKEIGLAKGLERGPQKKIISISAGADGGFLAVSDNEVCHIAKTDDGLLLVDPTLITIETEIPRVEIPASGTKQVAVTPDVFDYKGEKINDGITDFSFAQSYDGVSASWDGTTLTLDVTSDAEGGKGTLTATDKNGKTHDYEIVFAKETGIALDGFLSVALPGYGEENAQYTYSAKIIGSDGLEMSGTATIEAVSLTEGASFDSETGVLTLAQGGKGGKFTLRVTSDTMPQNTKDFEVTVNECMPTTIEFTGGDKEVLIPDAGTQSVGYTALIKDQVQRPMPDKEIVWSVKENLNGVSADSKTGVLTVSATADKGEITVVAKAAENEEIKAEKKVTLKWSDLRCIKEDLAKYDDKITTGENLQLAKTGENGTEISWATSDKTVITDQGEVTRNRRNDTSATLTATGKKNDKSFTKKIEVTVLKADNIANVGDFEDGENRGLPGETVTSPVHGGSYALKANGDVSFDVKLNNDSSYIFEVYVKAEGNIKISSKLAGELASVPGTGEYTRIAGSFDSRKQEASFDDTLTISANGEYYVDDIKVFEITLEYEKLMEAITKAEYTKKKADIDAAKALLASFYDVPAKSPLETRINAIKPSSNGGGSGNGGSSGGSGGGGAFVPPSQNGSGTTGISGTTVDNDEKVYEALLLFKDLSHHWAKDDVEFMANLGIVNGVSDKTFNPDANITRAEFAKLIVKTVGLSESEYENTYYDIVSEDWFAGYAQTAKNEGYISGYNGMFRPYDNITREEIAKIIVSAYNQKKNKTLEIGGALYYDDIQNVSAWAYDYIVEAVNEGFMNGVSEERFAPKNNATRAQAVVLLKRLYDKING